MRLFEVHDDLPSPVEVGERAGLPVIRMLRGVRVSEALADHIDDLVGGPTAAAGPKHRRPRQSRWSRWSRLWWL